MDTKRILLLVISIVAILVALALVFWGFRELSGTDNDYDEDLINDGFGIASFEECVQAGYPVMESYPRQCRTPDGTVFIEGGGVEPGDEEMEEYNGQGLQTPAGPLFLSYANGYVRLYGTLQRNDACVNWVVKGTVEQHNIIFRVDPEKVGEVCAQVVTQQQVESLVKAPEGVNVSVILEGDMVIFSGPVSQDEN